MRTGVVKNLLKLTHSDELKWRMKGDRWDSPAETRIGGYWVTVTADGEIIVRVPDRGKYPMDTISSMVKDVHKAARREAWEELPKEEVMEGFQEELESRV